MGLPVREWQGRRQREDARSPRRQGRGTRRDDERQAPGPRRIHHHHRRLQRVLRVRKEAAAGTLGSGAESARDGRALDEEEARRPEGPAPRLGALRCRDEHARNDGHGPEPRPERREPERSREAHEERALRLGCLSAVHLDVRPDRPRDRRRQIRPRPRGEKESRARRDRSGAIRETARAARRGVQDDRPRRNRQTIPDRATGPAAPGHRGGVRLVVRAARKGLPQAVQDFRRPGHRLQRGHDGVRKHG